MTATGTFRIWSDVRLESVVRTKTDSADYHRFMGSRPGQKALCCASFFIVIIIRSTRDRLMAASRSRSAFRLAREQDGDAGNHQHDADHRKSIAETHHQRLPLDGVAKRNDGLLMRGRRIAHAVRQEEVGHLLDPGADFLAAKMD